MAIPITAGFIRILYQIRVKPKLGFFYRHRPIYYDSATVFSTPRAAQIATGEYIRGLISQGLLNPKKAYEVEIINLTLLNPPIEGNEDMKKSREI